MLSHARKLLEEHCSRHPSELHARIAWLSLCERTGELSISREWLRAVSPTVVGSPRELMALAQFMDRHLADEKCLRLAYRALRAGYSDASIHLAYMGLFFFGATLCASRTQPDEVSIDTAVTLKEENSVTIMVRIIESEADFNIERDEVAPNDPLAKRLMGLRVGRRLSCSLLADHSIIAWPRSRTNTFTRTFERWSGSGACSRSIKPLAQ
jgi:hypothetical protein